ncbi:mycofactocin biosynthesis peptidyl-dipeptidase MftE [Ilumatobacter nonamiensis]|uniref:mycofactocin biosynthesis peptidyl-dipeptidase MftE n=1 Tax=Ilumatobacter nonamiensis TaxID=467093 RepID=UPI00034C40B8|nr:mycofactocin biosynthesis peptidyl-dipeptidase MftE [Ilumatobacter nonamiensis]
MRLGEATWTEVDTATKLMADDDGTLSPIVLIPVGSTEQHGPHLPLNTDTLVAEEIAGRALHRTTGLMLGPTISVSASGEHAGFAGTLSIGTDVMADVAIELGRSADWAAGVVFVNGHGGNHDALTRAVELLTAEGRSVFSWWPRWRRRTDGGPPDLHAGRIETSLMLAIDPGLVRLELGTRGPDHALDELLPQLRSHGVRDVSPSGVLGDPEGASGAEGERFIADFVDDLVIAIERWRPIDPTPHAERKPAGAFTEPIGSDPAG